MTFPGSGSRRHGSGWFALVAREVKWQLLLFRRVPMGPITSFVFPIVLLFLFTWRYGGQSFGDTGLDFAQAVTPGIAAIAVVISCYVNLAVSVTTAREQGILKRLRGTPLPASAYVFARILTATLVGFLSALLMILIAVTVLDVEVRFGGLLLASTALVLGAACFCALGLSVVPIIPSTEVAPAVTNLTLLPLLFLSNTLFAFEGSPGWLDAIVSRMPLEPFAAAVRTGFVAHPDMSAFVGDLAVVAAWGVAAAIFAHRFFGWEPKAEDPGRFAYRLLQRTASTETREEARD